MKRSVSEPQATPQPLAGFLPVERVVLIEWPTASGSVLAALPVGAITRVFDLAAWSTVPGAPPEIAGIVAHQGRIVTLFAGSALFSETVAVLAPAQVVLLDVPPPAGRWGLLVMRICGVARLDELANEAGEAEGCVGAYKRWRDRPVRLLDPPKVFNMLREPFAGVASTLSGGGR